jgi:hypothetical protein
MTCARSDIVETDKVGIYHCTSRCVRRAFLCGKDPYTGKSFEHRRKWIRQRLCFLVGIFGIEVMAYAIMSDHLHSLLRIRPDLVRKWSDQEVARRWLLLFPRPRMEGEPETPTQDEIDAIASLPKLVKLYRERLSSISWFNRCLKENIARRANEEDGCTGHFWEGRFKSPRVYDVAGILACGVYVDLNPVRAGMAKTPEQSDHTSVQDRIFEYQGSAPARHKGWPKIPLVSIPEMTENRVTLPEYIKLVDETGRLLVSGKASISPELAPILERLQISSEHWIETTKNLGRMFRRVIGPVAQLEKAAKRAQKCWFQGMSSARLAFASN